MLVFPGFELLDLAGPLDVLARAPDTRAVVVARTRQPVAPDLAPPVTPDHAIDDAPAIDVLFIPGGHGIAGAFGDDALLDFIQSTGRRAKYVTSVCTGALLLGVAGLLQGRRATTHWRYIDMLPMFGSVPVRDRVVEDGNLITGGGVTAGIDFGFTLVARLHGEAEAKRIQLGLEYDPAPPFRGGHPSVAPAADVDAYVRDTAPRYQERERLAREAIARRSRP